MRIGLLIYGSLGTLSGGYLYDRRLVEFLHQAGDDVEIISLPWRSYAAHLTDNLSLFLPAKLRRLNLDVLLQDELNHPSLFWVNRRLRASDAPVPLVGIVHHLRSSEEHPRLWRPLYRSVERAFLRTLDGFVFNSETTRHSVTNLLGETPAPGVTAYPGADHLPAPDAQATTGLIQKRRIRSGPLRILFVGNLIPRKGLHLLLAALLHLPSGAWTLDVVGAQTVDGAYSARLLQLVTDHQLWSQVRFWGRVSDEELCAHYERADLLAVPSYEGFGIVYLEAMAFGLPVLASAEGAAREIVQQNHNGLLVFPDSSEKIAGALAGLLEDRGRLAAMGQRARQRFESHPRWADSAAKIRRFLQQEFS